MFLTSVISFCFLISRHFRQFNGDRCNGDLVTFGLDIDSTCATHRPPHSDQNEVRGQLDDENEAGEQDCDPCIVSPGHRGVRLREGKRDNNIHEQDKDTSHDVDPNAALLEAYAAQEELSEDEDLGERVRVKEADPFGDAPDPVPVNVDRRWELNGPKRYKDGYNNVHTEFVQPTHKSPTLDITHFSFGRFVGWSIIFVDLINGLLLQMAALNVRDREQEVVEHDG